MTRLLLWLSVLFTVAGGAPAAETDEILETYISLALTQNPRIAAATGKTRAADERVRQTAALPEPMLGFGLKELSAKESSLRYTDMSAAWIALEQRFPFPGTLKAERRMARSEAGMARAEAEEMRARLTRDVKMSYYEWALVRAERERIEAGKVLMQRSREAALRAYEAGMGTQSDALRAATETAKLDLLLADLAQRERRAIADINVCCALPPDAQTTPPAPLEFRRIEIPYDTLWALIESESPMLRAERQRTEAAQNGIRIARTMFYPEFSLGIELMRRGRGDLSDNMVSLMGGISLPIYRSTRQYPRLREKQAEYERTSAEYQNAANELRFQLSEAFAKVTALQQQIALFDSTLLPQARQTFAAAQAAYGAGKLEFMELLSHQMMVLDMERERLMKVADYLMTWAHIEALTGRRLF